MYKNPVQNRMVVVVVFVCFGFFKQMLNVSLFFVISSFFYVFLKPSLLHLGKGKQSKPMTSSRAPVTATSSRTEEAMLEAIMLLPAVA